MGCFNAFYSTFFILTVFVVLSINCDDYGEIAKAKCKEYAQAVYSTQSNPILSVRSLDTISVSECGMVSVPLIIGGEMAMAKEFPHMALIGFGLDTSISWQCGGALISEDYVLTAAHCIYSQSHGPATKVKFGMVTLSETSDEDEYLEINIVKSIPHPDYKKPMRYNDIALMLLMKKIDFTGYIRPACLNTHVNFGNNKATATGFGKTDYAATEGSKFLRKVVLDIIPKSICAASFKSESKKTMKQGVTDSMLCAGVLKGGKDTCQGDSGGPLQISLKKPYCMYSLVGITSFGKYCGFANSPAVYSRVSYYVPWIESVVWKNETKQEEEFPTIITRTLPDNVDELA